MKLCDKEITDLETRVIRSPDLLAWLFILLCALLLRTISSPGRLLL